MAEKTPRKNASRRKETEQNLQKTSTVTPIDQAGPGQSQSIKTKNHSGTGQSQGRTAQEPPVSASSKVSDRSASSPASSEASIRSASSPTASQIGAHPSADQSGAAKSPSPITKNIGSSPSALNPGGSVQGGSVQEGRQAAGLRPSGQELHERIRVRAYELFELRGRREGYDREDWAQAEAEVLGEFEREKSA